MARQHGCYRLVASVLVVTGMVDEEVRAAAIRTAWNVHSVCRLMSDVGSEWFE